MTLEAEVAALTVATTALIAAVATQQTGVNAAVAGLAAVTTRVNTGLQNVDNTTDVGKPLSTAATNALATKQATLVSGVNISTINGFSVLGGAPLVIPRGATSLTATAYDSRAALRVMSPIEDDSTVVEALGLFMWIPTKLEPDDDETCFNTALGQWLLKVPAWDLIDAWNLFEQSYTDDDREDEPTRFATYHATA